MKLPILADGLKVELGSIPDSAIWLFALLAHLVALSATVAPLQTEVQGSIPPLTSLRRSDFEVFPVFGIKRGARAHQLVVWTSGWVKSRVRFDS
ncbi:hypothetical protein F5B20DRAFT_132211 [Whalleya microplaca]|nr:hypothetical protein F5B20DRAFT_132211 [Whalleya microplaca]